MKMIVGLGNPGSEYAKTRHNAGFMVVDRLCALHARGEVAKGRFGAATIDATIAGEKCLLLKPTTYMNLSGRAVAEAVRFYKIDPIADMLVIVDDLYLPVGRVRARSGGSAGGHNGLSDIQRAIGTDAYPRVRVGVGLRPNGGKPPMMDQADFVLSRFGADEEDDLNASIETAAKAAATFVQRGIDVCMNECNAPASEPKRAAEDSKTTRERPVDGSERKD
ncbi:MAG: aminoacyl-tRNA hydrolase [Phycisphaerales bacterium]|nr:aminoacyl-tRNA hydrolase [Phycisphaerales bacterium]